MKNVFLKRSTIDEDWDLFVRRTGISDPEAYLSAAEHSIESIKLLELGISTVCNFNCPFCFNHYSPETGYYSRAEISAKKIIDTVKRNQPLREVQLAVCGEPLLHKEFFPILEGVAPFVDGIRISTNGSLLTPKVADRLSEFPISWISVSAEAGDRETYERFRENGRFDQFKKNISYAKRQFEDRISFTSVLSSANADSMLAMPKLCSELGGVRHIHILDAVIHPKHRDRGLRKLSNTEILEFVPSFLEECDRYGIKADWFQRFMDLKTSRAVQDLVGPLKHIDSQIYSRPCHIPFTQLTIDAEGNFNSCCSVDPKNGDAFGSKIVNLFNDPQTLKLRVLNHLKYFARICRKYCHKVPDTGTDYSLKKFREEMSISRLASKVEYAPAASIEPGTRLLIWPCGSLTRKLLKENYLSEASISGLVDGSPGLWGREICGHRIYSPDDAKGLPSDGILITTGTYYNEILLEIENLFGLHVKKILMIDLNYRLKQLIGVDTA
jgi:MoaA/NifB/PqqE/SkfB family radical SAM enzyme